MYRRERVQHSLEVLLSLCVIILGKHVENLWNNSVPVPVCTV